MLGALGDSQLSFQGDPQGRSRFGWVRPVSTVPPSSGDAAQYGKQIEARLHLDYSMQIIDLRGANILHDNNSSSSEIIEKRQMAYLGNRHTVERGVSFHLAF
jgi:hypothetical protein